MEKWPCTLFWLFEIMKLVWPYGDQMAIINCSLISCYCSINITIYGLIRLSYRDCASSLRHRMVFLKKTVIELNFLLTFSIMNVNTVSLLIKC